MNIFRAAIKKALENVDEGKEVFKAGNIVEIKVFARIYYPGGSIILFWVKSNYYFITQDKLGGKLVIKVEKEYVF